MKKHIASSSLMLSILSLLGTYFLGTLSVGISTLAIILGIYGLKLEHKRQAEYGILIAILQILFFIFLVYISQFFDF